MCGTAVQGWAPRFDFSGIDFSGIMASKYLVVMVSGDPTVYSTMASGYAILPYYGACQPSSKARLLAMPTGCQHGMVCTRL
jgi:hypothetical protein